LTVLAENPAMKLNRREFLLLTRGLAAGCQGGVGADTATTGSSQNINAGPASDYAVDGVYSRFADQGFFIIRRGGQIFALSAVCTHRKCKLTAKFDHSYYCKCHGSTFDADGHVTQGPAHRDLPMFSTSISGQEQLLVAVTST
jgi:Rieske Fe-S protein